MKRIILCILTALLTLMSLAAEKKENIMDKKVVYAMGEPYGTDSSKVSHRSFPKRLVMPKGAMGVGLQFLWAQMDASNLQALAMLTNATGKVGFGNVAPAFLYAYANNNAIGLRLAYSRFDMNVVSGNLKLISDDIALNLPTTSACINTYGASVFNRSWFGLDKQGRFALFADVDLGYSYSATSASGAEASTHRIGLSFSPGLEIFVMNNLSLYFSLSFANLYYDMSKSANGYSNKFNAQVRLSILDTHFGLAYYF